MNDKATLFLEKILEEILINKTTNNTEKVKNKLEYFTRVLIQDSTVVSLHKKFLEYFPGSKNQCGKKSALKIQAVLNLFNPKFEYFEISAFTKNDQKASHDTYNFLSKGDLIIRDLGYFVLKVFRDIINKKAFFISRIKYGVDIFDVKTGKKIDLLRYLKKNKFADMQVLIGKKEKLLTRLVALKLPECVAEARKRKLSSSRDQKLNPSKNHMELMNWGIFITNIDHSVLQAKDIANFYSLRWKIEITFKSWKSSFNFNIDKFKFSLNQLKVLILARLIVIVAITNYTMKYLKTKIKENKYISELKLLNFISENCFIIFYDIISVGNIEDFIFQNIIYEKRKRKSLEEKIACAILGLNKVEHYVRA